MELVRALERLSLEVRNNLGTNIANFQSQNLSGCQTKNGSWQYTPQNNFIENGRQDIQVQLDEFDRSIKTLFAQITDLGSLDSHPNQSHSATPIESVFNARGSDCGRRPYLHRHPGAQMLIESKLHPSIGSNGSTSQEDDSDCSSQQSGPSTHANYGPMDAESTQPDQLVGNLFKRGSLGAITDTMKKLSKILTVGNEISCLLTRLDQPCVENSGPKLEDYVYAKSLCNSFRGLCRGESCINSLPTIKLYNESCNKLSNMISDVTERSTANQNQMREYLLLTSAQDINDSMKIDDDRVISITSQTGDDSGDDFVANTDEVAFLDCDQKRVDNWTENKLYMNHQ